MQNHPDYNKMKPFWDKYRIIYEGGERFKNCYLFQRPKEKPLDFADRQKNTYNPAFAKSGIRRINNAISQRMGDVKRDGGSELYAKCTKGELGGVDLANSTMNTFICDQLLPELLVQGKVGTYIDATRGQETRATNARPYLYIYPAEDILNWHYSVSDPSKLEALLVRDSVYEFDGPLPIREKEQYRLYEVVGNSVQVWLSDTRTFSESTTLNLPEIPFVISEIHESLLKEVSDYQITLLNICSSDIAYILRSNIPFYTEQYDPREEAFKKREAVPTEQDEISAHAKLMDNSDAVQNGERTVGTTAGVRYPINVDRPGFIHPSSEPLSISMEKQEQIKQEINLLMDISLLNLQGRASAESRELTDRPMESGLKFLGQQLAATENQIAHMWSLYEDRDAAVVSYPDQYDLRTEEQRIAEADNVLNLKDRVTSNTYRRELMKRAVSTLLSHRVPVDELETINQEIDNAPGTTGDPESIAEDFEHGLVGTETASLLRGYLNGESEKAKNDHLERLVRIAESQSNATRGNPDTSGDPQGDSKKEKEISQNPDTSDMGERRVRGNAR